MTSPRLLIALCASILVHLPAPADASFINYSSREINCKIVYYGSQTAGLRENLKYVYARTSPDAKGKYISLATETETTEFFDFLPLSLGEIRGFKTRFHLYTVPGHVLYEASRKLILKGVDGIVFVVDADRDRAAETLETWKGLRENLEEQGYDLDRIPLVVQIDRLHTEEPRRFPAAANVRNPSLGRFLALVGAERALDVAQVSLRIALDSASTTYQPRTMSETEVRLLLGLGDTAVFAARSDRGDGVFDSLKGIAKLVLTELKREG